MFNNQSFLPGTYWVPVGLPGSVRKSKLSSDDSGCGIFEIVGDYCDLNKNMLYTS